MLPAMVVSLMLFVAGDAVPLLESLLGELAAKHPAEPQAALRKMLTDALSGEERALVGDLACEKDFSV